MPSISVERTIGKTKKAVLDGLIRYNDEKMGKQKYKRIAVSLRDGNKIVGGIVGEVWTAVLFIQFFWLEQRLRGKNFGTRLIKAIENEARRIGATHAYVYEQHLAQNAAATLDSWPRSMEFLKRYVSGT